MTAQAKLMMNSNTIQLVLIVMLALVANLSSIQPVQSKPSGPAKQLRLEHGGLLITNTDQIMEVATRFGQVRCAPGSTVYIFDNGRAASIFNFDSNGKDDVRIAIDKKHILIRPAEQLVISPISKATFKSINPGLGIVHKKPQLVDLGTEMTAYMAEFSLASGVQRIPILRQMASSKKPGEKKALERILKNAAILQSSAERILQKRQMPPGMMAGIPDKLPAGQMLQGGVERFGMGAKQFLDMGVNETYRRGFPRFAGLSWVELIDNDWKLRDLKSTNSPCEVAGLLTCPIDTVIKTELGYIDCKKGSTVFIVNRGESIAVCTLDSPHVDDVNVRISNKPPMRLAPGREILLTRDLENSFDKVNPTHQIGYRDEKEIGTVEGTKVVRADFSLAAAMMAVEPLRRLATSKDSQEVNLAESIVKNSVILWGLTANHGVFHAPK